MLVGSVACPFIPYHATDANPFHSYLIVPDRHADHVPSAGNSPGDPGGNDQTTASFHNHSLAASDGEGTFSANAIMEQIDLPHVHLGSLLLSPGPLPVYTEAFISPPDKPPPSLSV